ncbi:MULTISPECIES: DUF3015 family protein [Citrifermentans]|uniref:DUF3015 domain-containing protein n=1 Tax=Citrifermentans bemidjiense (strain ATCC BAA-1014 / DSM 16622 / JCM 12645 / Bem) TaxID=404380 RepID=B5ECE0_CITBB|nr:MULTISPECIES: DUF3015 family protein [Citrifermentans]ACH37568.1 protein of unknown function DUF3015 [Citrifermentans bemidjiense Bem]
MKKLLLGFLLSLTVSGAAYAAQAHTNTGCGLGTMLFQNKADNSIALQVLQATTNGSFGSQTFGISSGTSECQQPGKIAQNEKLNEFVRANMDNLAKEIAMGKGETLDTFVEMLGVNPAQGDAYKSSLQANFNNIFTSDKIVLAEVIDNAVAITR